MPIEEFPPIIPFTVHVTDKFVVFVTVARNCCVPPRSTEALVGETLTPITGGGGGFGAVVPLQELSNVTQSKNSNVNVIPIAKDGGFRKPTSPLIFRLVGTSSHKARWWPVFRLGTFPNFVA